MRESHTSLIGFTLAAQAAVGVLAACLGFDAAISGETATTVLKRGLFCTALLLIIANISATLHLGNKFRAPFALINLKTSWLSREVVLTAMLTGGVFLVSAVSLIREIPHNLLMMLFAGFIALGLILVYCMSRLYMIPTMLGWNHAMTLLEFFSTMLLLGVLFYLSMIHFMERPSPVSLQRVLPMAEGAVILLAALKVVLIPYDMARRGKWRRGPRVLTPTWTASRHWFIARSILLFAGLALFFISQWVTQTNLQAEFPLSAVPVRVVPGVLLILSAEILGRYLFYHANEKNGL